LAVKSQVPNAEMKVSGGVELTKKLKGSGNAREEALAVRCPIGTTA
jgi:hypothetical protein